jgi:signal transduction histidine kinase
MSATLEKDVVQYGLIIGVCYQFYQSIISMVPIMHLQQAMVNILITVFLVFLFVITLRVKHVQWVAFALHLVALAGFTYFWIWYGGLAGTVPSFLCLYISFIVISSHDNFQLVGVTLLLALVGVFILFPIELGMTGFFEENKIGSLQATVDYLIIAGTIVLFANYVKRKFIFYRDKAAKRYLQLNQIVQTLADQNRELTSREAETRAINENLEVLVADRTREVENQNKALTEFAFINAHMLRGPLCRIIGLIQLMENYPTQYNTEQLSKLKKVAGDIDTQIKVINRVVS